MFCTLPSSVTLSYSQWWSKSVNLTRLLFWEGFCSIFKLNHFPLGICVYKVQIPDSFEIMDSLSDFSDWVSITAPLLTSSVAYFSDIQSVYTEGWFYVLSLKPSWEGYIYKLFVLIVKLVWKSDNIFKYIIFLITSMRDFRFLMLAEKNK